MTADGVLVVHHDERLNPDITRDTSGAWIVELERYDVGRIEPGTAYAARFAAQHDFRGLREVARIAPELPRSCLTSADTMQPCSPWTAGLPVGASVPDQLPAR